MSSDASVKAIVLWLYFSPSSQLKSREFHLSSLPFVDVITRNRSYTAHFQSLVLIYVNFVVELLSPELEALRQFTVLVFYIYIYKT